MEGLEKINRVKVTFINKDGSEQTVEAPVGLSLLEIAHKFKFDLEGACEGSMACSTCHVYIDPDWFDKLEPATEAEEDMLDLAFGLTEASRLGCQIIINEKLDGIKVTLPSANRNINV